jgi:hypothetical protein
VGNPYEASGLSDTAFAKALCTMYFGEQWDGLRYGRYIHRAYRDFNRTPSGFARAEDRGDALDAARTHLAASLHELGRAAVRDQEAFDAWHALTCRTLIEDFGEWRHGGKREVLSHGQAQKWVNMALKYLFIAHALGVEEKLGEIPAAYEFAHLPIDGIILKELRARDIADTSVPWSRMDADLYLGLQEEVRRASVISCAMDLEFKWWREPTDMEGRAQLPLVQEIEESRGV